MKKYHFIGIKGAGMSALAQVLFDMGHEVQGSDITSEVFTEYQLKKKGIKILPFSEDNIVEGFTYIAGNAFNDDHEEIKKALETGYPVIRYHKFLSEFMKDYTSIAVTGSHGKTSTTGLLSHVMNGDKETTYLIGDGTGVGKKEADYFAFESCEYRRHFLAYHPDYAIITNIDFDHPDYFKDVEDVVSAFQSMANQVTKAVVAYGNDPYINEIKLDVPMYTYGIDGDYTVEARNVEVLDNGTSFDLYIEGEYKDNFIIPLYGDHLILNSLAVITICYLEGFDFENIKSAFLTYGGVKRRFSETKFKSYIVVDDYAHHPKEIEATLETARKKYKNHQVVAVFQPHTFSRTEKFLNEFADSLKEADKVYIVDIFGSAREQSGNLSSEDLVKLIPGSKLLTEAKIKELDQYEDSVIIFMGAGDIQKYEKRFTELIS
ncbi:UDP-N-acetylmuramate--L-alanine ligase [Nosocomiicoccus massiliensis]|uniref:UDP-N-acetylmuramate--L-alanine ligase n=1 Tax=Nosocomiicoccus massiliensis TaxID=1232430 RepID=UPI0004099D05|nr:UDP-N-acetylmuramate--L-alanine ligase [Nosocomiicoccus massiliensis]